MQEELRKPPTRNAVSLRLPPEITQAVNTYARTNNVRKTDAYIHFLKLGLQVAEGPAAAGSDMRVIRKQLGEVLSILKGECA